MHLKVSRGGFRFRITAEELGLLLSGESLDQNLGDWKFSYGVSPFAGPGDLSLERKADGFCLHASKQALERLCNMGKSKDGVAVRQGDIDVSLQVDVREPTKKAA